MLVLSKCVFFFCSKLCESSCIPSTRIRIAISLRLTDSPRENSGNNFCRYKGDGLDYFLQRKRSPIHDVHQWADRAFDKQFQLLLHHFSTLPTTTECFGVILSKLVWIILSWKKKERKKELVSKKQQTNNREEERFQKQVEMNKREFSNLEHKGFLQIDLATRQS